MQRKIIKLGIMPIPIEKFMSQGGWGKEEDLSLRKIDHNSNIKEILLSTDIDILISEDYMNLNLANKITK